MPERGARRVSVHEPGTKILVLDGDTRAGLAVLQSLGRSGHACTVAAVKRCPAFASHHAARAVPCPNPLAERSGFQAWVLAFQRQERFRLILPCTDESLLPLHEVRATEELRDVLVLPPAAAIEIAFHKERLRRAAEKLGIPTPRTLFLAAAADVVPAAVEAWVTSYPVVVKPVRSRVWIGDWGSPLHVRHAGNREQLFQRIQELLPLTEIQLQDWVPGVGVGVEVLACDGQVRLQFAHERIHEYPLTGGGSTYRKSIPVPTSLAAASAQLVESLGWHGVAMAEFRMEPDTNRYWLMEVNGRFWGSLPLALFAGADFPAQLVELLLQRRGSAPHIRTPPVFARNFVRDLQWTKRAIEARRSHSRLPAGSLARSCLQWFRVFTGREIWDGASWRDPAPILVEVFMAFKAEARQLARGLARWRNHRWRRRMAGRLVRLDRAKHLLVLCEGNICRSPYAEMRLRQALHDLPVRVGSGGFLAPAGRTVPELFARIAGSRGADLSQHRSRVVDAEAVSGADVILLMDRSNGRRLRSLDPQAEQKAVWLGALDPGGNVEIADPFGRSADDVAEILSQIDRCVEALAARLRARRGGDQPRPVPAPDSVARALPGR